MSTTRGTNTTSAGTMISTVGLGYLLPLASARAVRVVAMLVILLFALVLAGHMLGFLSARTLLDLRRGIVMPGVPIAAALLSEISLREGITQRTLLYTLFGPVSRDALAIGRTALTALLLALGAMMTSLLLQLVARVSSEGLARELVAMFFASFAYVGLFGLLHLVSNRGLVSAITLYSIFDDPLGRLPFSMRLLAPSFHVRTISGIDSTFKLPIDVDAAESTPVLSAVVLVLVAAAAIYVTALLFRRKPLGELC